ncbi:alpha/beta hydrolase [Actinomycetospora sp. NBRC 106378]|uniref:alpha/beta hydrolase n=1 Tax=Actinomycetospora sp. NBRC 106378 TaxID=3032208 RepID=UPI0024A37B13|nr:alpha/beta hydrolase [Actinomycetospora sp. NBRC 106378]GLZ55947.1 hypothetical protein Acsp07_55640 [Actinomycetospora sp. NBRC 106378]
MTSSAVLRRAVIPVLLAVVVLGASASAVARPVRAALVDAGRPHPSSGTGPDLRSVFTATSDGAPLHVSFWFPTPGPGAAPVLVWVHGGGWIAGSDVDRPADLRRYAQEGWLVMSVEYELARPGRPTWDLAGPQVACALGRLAAEAAPLGGDVRRLVLAGASAGGQLAVSVGYRAATGTQDSSCGLPVPVPSAVVAEYPALDPVDGYERGVPRADSRAFKRAYTGGTPAEVPERYRAVTGVDALSRDAPPTLLVEGGADRLVPRAGLDRFVVAARALGVPVDHVVVPGADHAFDAVDGSPGQRAGHVLLSEWARERVALPL